VVLLVVEVLLLWGLVGSYRWLEIVYCDDFATSGHCYESWFENLETILPGLTLCLCAITVLGLVAILTKGYRRLALQWTLYSGFSLLLVFLWFVEGLFLKEVIITMGIAKTVQYLLLRCDTKWSASDERNRGFLDERNKR